MKLNPKLFHRGFGPESNFQVISNLDIAYGFGDLWYTMQQTIERNYARLGRPVKHRWAASAKWVLNSYLMSEIIYYYLFSEEKQKRTAPFVLPPDSLYPPKLAGINPDKHWTLITKYQDGKPWEITDLTHHTYIDKAKQVPDMPSFINASQERLDWDYTKGKESSFYTAEPSKKAQYAIQCILEFFTCREIKNQQMYIKSKNLQLENYIMRQKGQTVF